MSSSASRSTPTNRRAQMPAHPALPALSALEPMPGLARQLAVPQEHLLVLREDLIGFAGGGNKVRKAAASLYRAACDGITTVVTTGAEQSNHARAVAVIGAQLALKVVLVLEGEDPGHRRGNLLLEQLAGAHIMWAGSGNAGDVAAEQVKALGVKARLVPFGGSDAAAVEVYAEVGHHLQAAVPDLRHVVVALGSGATAAGLVAALGSERVLAVNTGAVSDARTTLTDLLQAARPDRAWDPLALRVDDGQVGAGYEHAEAAVLRVVQQALRADGIAFDVTYVGRALASLISAVGNGTIQAGQRTVLVHTGGLPGLFGHPDLQIPRPSL